MLRPISLRAAFSSATPRLIVLRATPVAAATAVTPPRPSEIASLAANNRRPRSSKNGDILSNRLRRLSTSITTTRYRYAPTHRNDISILSLRSLTHFDSIISRRFLSVGQGSLCQVPGFVPPEICVIEQDPHQLRYCQCRVRIVELNRNLVGQFAPVGVLTPEAANEIGQRAGNQKVFLH